MAYDRIDWHSEGDFPEDLPPEGGGTHIGMFLAWCIINKLSGEFHDEESADALTAVRERRMTGRDFLQRMCDEKLWEEDLSVDGNSFAAAYYTGPGGKGYGPYIDDYEAILAPQCPSLYHVEDNWTNFDLISARITQRYDSFKRTGSVRL